MTTNQSNDSIARIDSEAAAKIAAAVEDYSGLIKDAAEATENEKSLGILDSIKAYPKAVFYSIGISLAIVMEGYDTLLLGNFFAQPAFQKKFGICNNETGKCQLTAAWQTGLQNGAQIGSITGLLTVGWLTDYWGYRKTLIISLFFMAIFNFVPFFANNLITLLIGQILQGLPWGLYQSMAVAYAADICPVSLRPILTTYVNLCWVFGHLVAAGVLRSTVERKDKWAWKIPYSIQWVWIPFVLFVAFIAPESPWFLIRKGKFEEAEKSILQLQGKRITKEQAKKTVAMLKHTNELEKAEIEGANYKDCFRGTNLRRTEIGIVVFLTQAYCGSQIMGWYSYLLIQAGLPTTDAFSLNIGNHAIAAIGTISSWYTMRFLGRRTLYLIGESLMTTTLFIVGVISSLNGSPYIVGGLLMFLTAFYHTTVGPVCYSLVAEIPSTRLRAKSVVISRISYNLAGITNACLTPRMLNPKAWNLGGKSAFVWMGTCTLCLIWTWFRLPEPKGRLSAELDILFENKVNSRKFKTTKVDQFGELNNIDDQKKDCQEKEKVDDDDEEDLEKGKSMKDINGDKVLPILTQN